MNKVTEASIILACNHAINAIVFAAPLIQDEELTAQHAPTINNLEAIMDRAKDVAELLNKIP